VGWDGERRVVRKWDWTILGEMAHFEAAARTDGWAVWSFCQVRAKLCSLA